MAIRRGDGWEWAGQDDQWAGRLSCWVSGGMAGDLVVNGEMTRRRQDGTA